MIEAMNVTVTILGTVLISLLWIFGTLAALELAARAITVGVMKGMSKYSRNTTHEIKINI